MSASQSINTWQARLREPVEEARRAQDQALHQGTGGRAACERLSRTYDELIIELWQAALAEEGDPPLALVATGGWGRQEVCPYSDIDFILLTPDSRPDSRPDSPAGAARRVAERLLYPLWDARIQVGHAVRTPVDAAHLAGDDLSTATALLDARHVVGDPALSDALHRATRRSIAPGGNSNDFVGQLVDERARRRDKFGDTLYLLEPNLKHGIGALRDVSTALWAAKARWSVRTASALVPMGQLTSRQARVLEQGLDFLLMLRSLLQLSAGRATDQLTFEIQEAVAPHLYPDAKLPEGDIRPAVTPAVEALMQRFYLHARDVVRVSDRVVEMARVPARRKPRIRHIDSVFLTFNGKLAIRDPQIFRERPAEMLRLFRVALDHDVPIYGHTKELIAEILAAGEVRLAGDPVAARYFLDALVDVRDRGQPSLLEQMHQIGLLSAVMPEFAPCTCRVQHDLYHVYTVDQHQLLAVAMLKRLARGELRETYPTASAAVARVAQPVPLYLGTLLHDVGKPLGKGHAEKGARLARTIGERLGLAAGDVEITEFLVRQHLTMAHLSQRRDLSDPEVISRFAGRVGDEQRLTQLYLCTMCDTAMTAPGNLSAWKNQLLEELYRLSRLSLRGGAEAEELDPAEQSIAVREHIMKLLRKHAPDLLQAEEATGQAPTGVAPAGAAPAGATIDDFVAGLDERLLSSASPRQLARLVRLAWQQRRSGAPAEIAVSYYPLKGHSELAVVTGDVHGLLAGIAGTLAANRIDVLGAVIGSLDVPQAGARPQALDVFFVRDLYGKAIPAEDGRWQRLRDDLGVVLRGGGVGEAAANLLAQRHKPSGLGPRVTPGVPTQVSIHNDASSDATVVEVFTRDRVGVLHAITRTLADMGLDIHLSKVATEGERVADIFYVTCGEPPHKLTDVATLRDLEARLHAVLGEV